jgi:hypothetical protein
MRTMVYFNKYLVPLRISRGDWPGAGGLHCPPLAAAAAKREAQGCQGSVAGGGAYTYFQCGSRNAGISAALTDGTPSS